MVLKKSKFNGNTGNTLRKKNNQAQYSIKRKQNDLFINENSTISRKKCGSTFFSDYKSPNPNHHPDRVKHVKYSMKKKNRWQVPKILDETFQNGLTRDAGEVQLVEILMDNDVDRFPRFPRHYLKPTGVSSIKNSLGRNENSFKSFRPNNIKIDDLEDIDVEYTVYKTKMTDTWPMLPDSHIWKGRYWSRKRKCYNNRVSNSKRIENQLLEFERDEVELFDEYHRNTEDEERLEPSSMNLIVDFKTLIENASKSKQTCFEDQNYATNFQPFQYEKGSYQFIERPTMMDESSYSIIEEDLHEEISVILSCKVDHTQITRAKLEQKYGDLYKEGMSFPRKFIIMENEDPLCRQLLFQIDCDLTGSSISDVVDLLVVFRHFTYSDELVEIIKKEEEFIDFYNLVNMVLPQKHVIGRKDMDKGFNNVEDGIQILQRKDVFQIADFYGKNQAFPSDATMEQYRTVNPIECQNCFCQLNKFTKLTECQHTFCNDCWSTYMKIQVSTSHNSHIFCIAYECDSKLDFVTIASFLPVVQYERYVNKFYQNSILKTKNIKCCPTKTCDNIIKVEQSLLPVKKISKLAKTMSVKCQLCQNKWCFTCQSKDHWPISCQLFQNYCQVKENLSKLGKFETLNKQIRSRVYGKHCPFCGKFIEKNGGCRVMICICSPDQFCWDCLVPFTKNSHLSGLCRTVDQEEFMIRLNPKEKRIVPLIETELKSDQLRALSYQLYRNCRKLSTLKSDVLHQVISTLTKSYRVQLMLMVAKEFSPTKSVSLNHYLNTLKFMNNLLVINIEKEVDIKNDNGVKYIQKSILEIENHLDKLFFKK